MVKIVFAGIVLIHALIHLMGYVKAYGFAELPQLTREIPKPIGLLWLAAAVVLLMAGAALIFKSNVWWTIAVLAVVVSQALIVMHWQDAKFGTIANAIILIAAVGGYGAWSFTSRMHTELDSFLQHRVTEKSVVTREQIGTVPPVVQRWLERSGVVGREAVRTVHVSQRGEMRSSKEGSWMPFEATQWFTTGTPGFFWTADVAAMPGIHLVARDRYEGGHGNMLIKALSLIPIADARGMEIDQGSMVRYLAELMWFPSAALDKYLRWEEIDSTTAKVTMTHADITASAIIKFDAQGDIISFEAQRYYDRKGEATLEDWYIQMDPRGYAEFEGIRIPTKSTVTWRLKDGDLTWLKLELTNVEYNSI